MPRRPAPLAALLLTAAAAAAAGPPGTVTGIVVDAAGEPVAGAEVGAVTDDGPAFTTTTAADGTFALPAGRWPDGRPRRPHLIARGPGGALAVGTEYPKADDFPATLTLKPPHRLRVTVRRPDGAPAAGVPVFALAGLRPVALGASGPDGAADLSLPAGAPLRAVVAVRPGAGFGYALTERPGPGEDAPPPPDRLDVRLSPTFTHRVRCVTVDPATGATVPTAGAKVSVWTVRQPGRSGRLGYVNLSGAGFAKTVAGPDGVATFGWLPKDYEGAIPLWVGGATADGGPAGVGGVGGGYGRVRSFVGRDPFVAPDEAAENVPGEHTVALEPLAALAGRVTNPDGSPAAGVRVRAEGLHSRPPFPEAERQETTADYEGRYELTVRGNAAYLVAALPGAPADPEADSPGGLAAATAGLDEPIVVPPGGRRDGLDFTLAPGTPLTGRVTRGGEPLAGVPVYLTQAAEFPEDLKHPEARFAHDLELRRRAVTDADGRYAFRLGPGAYRVGTKYQRRDQAKLSVAGTDPVRRDVVLDPPADPPAPVEITGTVVDEFGLTLSDVTVAAGEGRSQMREWPERTATARSGDDGAFAFTYTRSPYGRGRGVYLVATGVDEVRGPLYGYLDLQPRFASQDPPATEGVRLVARRLATFTGRALGPDGAPLTGVPLTLRPAGVMEGGGAGDPLSLGTVTGPAGRFLFRRAVCGVEQVVRFQPERTWTLHRVAVATLDRGTVTDIGVARGLVGDADIARPDLEDRRRTAFAEPDDLPAALAALRADAKLLNRHALLLVADPASEAGRDLFAALYDDAELGAAADARFLTRCLAAARPTRLTPLADLLDAPVDPAAATLVALDADGAVAGSYPHTVGERAAVRAFLAGDGAE